MKRCLCILFLIISINAAIAQTAIKKYVENHTIPITTINPDSTNFSDMKAIGDEIGNSRIVMLGEQFHLDASTFLAKTRLVKYLHEIKGFNVIAFESDFFALNNGWDKIQKNKGRIDSFLRNNILTAWAHCNTCENLLYDYIPMTQNTKSPIIVTGIDDQTFYTYSQKYLTHELDSVLCTLSIPITMQSNYHSEILSSIHTLITNLDYQNLNKEFFITTGKILQTIKDQIRNKLSTNNFWFVIVNDLIALNEQQENFFEKDGWQGNAVRDKQMYKNLEWLLQTKYPSRKIIVWAANNHIARYKNSKYTSMGKFLSLDTSLNNKVYVIGFTSYSGEEGISFKNTVAIPQPNKNSFESWVNDSLKYAFIGFQSFNKTNPDLDTRFKMRAWQYRTLKDQWNKIFDGIFFIRKMYPCKTNN